MKIILRAFLILAILMVQADAETFDSLVHCPARTSCHCEATKIECIKRDLLSVPIFLKTNWKFTKLQLSINNITILPNNVFRDLNVTELYLDDNQINVIQPDAFNGIQDQVTVLDLGRNKLVTLPNIIGKLSTLNLLDISKNPIAENGFQDAVMRQIGDFLHEFRFGSPSLKIWPQSLHHLQALHILKFYGGDKDFTNIPIWAFRSFEHTLKKLWIQNTNLIAVPVALQYLENIDEFHFDNNQFVGDAGILIPAFAGVTKSLRVLTLENNNLTTFPSVLLTLQNLNNLSLARNSLEFVSDQAVGLVSSDLRILNLQDCDLDRIPGALSKLPSVTDLDLSFNHITTIEKNDLQHMTNLHHVDVSNNPLRYISTSTFHDLKQLQTLLLRETFLYDVPKALANIPALNTLDLFSVYPSIECNCDLSWLYCYTHNNNTHLNIVGQCETVAMDITQYVQQKIADICAPPC